jgi:hypothetical protein
VLLFEPSSISPLSFPSARGTARTWRGTAGFVTWCGSWGGRLATAVARRAAAASAAAAALCSAATRRADSRCAAESSPRDEGRQGALRATSSSFTTAESVAGKRRSALRAAMLSLYVNRFHAAQAPMSSSSAMVAEVAGWALVPRVMWLVWPLLVSAPLRERGTDAGERGRELLWLRSLLLRAVSTGGGDGGIGLPSAGACPVDSKPFRAGPCPDLALRRFSMLSVKSSNALASRLARGDSCELAPTSFEGGGGGGGGGGGEEGDIASAGLAGGSTAARPVILPALSPLKDLSRRSPDLA